MGKKSKSKAIKEVQEKISVEKTVVVTSSAKKPTPAKKSASMIDEIFVGKKRKKIEDDKASEKSNKAKREKKRRFENDTFVDQTSGPKKRTNDGLAIYTEDELGMNKADVGSTLLCPFDCSCCF